MAHHLSAKKRIRQDEKRNISNSYYAKTARNAIKKLRTTKSKEEAITQLPEVSSMLDKLAKVHPKSTTKTQPQLPVKVMTSEEALEEVTAEHG